MLGQSAGVSCHPVLKRHRSLLKPEQPESSDPAQPDKSIPSDRAESTYDSRIYPL